MVMTPGKQKRSGTGWSFYMENHVVAPLDWGFRRDGVKADKTTELECLICKGKVHSAFFVC